MMNEGGRLYVEVLYNYESTNARGHTVNVHRGERYSLLNSNNEDWWYVAKPSDYEEGFYLPRTYVRLLDPSEINELENLSTFRPASLNIRNSAFYELARTTSDATNEANTIESVENLDLSLRLKSHRRTVSADANIKRLSKSIPVSLNFVQDLKDIPLKDGGSEDMNDSGVVVSTADSFPFRRSLDPQQLMHSRNITCHEQLDQTNDYMTDSLNNATSTDEEAIGTTDDDEYEEKENVSTVAERDISTSVQSNCLKVSDTGYHHRSYQNAIDKSDVDTVIYANANDLKKQNGVVDETCSTATNIIGQKDSAIYANLASLPPGKSDDPPPSPGADEIPLRKMHDGWFEYLDKHGRRYFYNSDIRKSSWKPPRSCMPSLKDSGNNILTTSSGEDIDSSLSTEELDRCHTNGNVLRSVELRNNASAGVYYSPVSNEVRQRASIAESNIHSYGMAPAPPPKPLKSRESIAVFGARAEVPSQMAKSQGLRFVNPVFGFPSTVMSRSADDAMVASSAELAEATVAHRTSTLPPLSPVNTSFDSLQPTESKQTSSHSPGGSALTRASTLPTNRKVDGYQQKYIMQGALNKCKYSEAGKRLKKQWESSYLYLLSAHLIFYKDQKSSEKKGNTYETPQGVCDLRGAKLTREETLTKRKNVFQIELVDGTSYLFQGDDQQLINEWCQAICEVIAKLPQPEFYPTPVIENQTAQFHHLDSSRFSRRSSETKSQKAEEITAAMGQKKALLKKEKEKRNSGLFHSNSVHSTSSGSSSHVDNQGSLPVEASPSKQTILEKLRRFFRHRPSIDSLKEKGIYKPEPVFGSSLAEICKREKSTVPKFIKVCTEVIEERGLDADGLYRISGNLSQIQKIRCQVDQDRYHDLIGEDDIHVLTGALKLFFRELQEPLFPLSMTKDFLSAIKANYLELQNPKQRLKSFRDLIAKMPLANHDTLDYLLKHLINVSEHSSNNRMQAHNLAIVFGPTLFTTSPSNANAQSGPKKAAKSSGGNRKTSATVITPSAPSQTETPSAGTQSNSHVAFNMIMQGQIVEYLLGHHAKIFSKA